MLNFYFATRMSDDDRIERQFSYYYDWINEELKLTKIDDT